MAGCHVYDNSASFGRQCLAVQEEHGLSDNDLKYRLIKMYGGISGNQLDTLEVIFHRDRDKTVIKNIRNDVEDFEYRTRIRAEKLEKARLLQQEAEELKP